MKNFTIILSCFFWFVGCKEEIKPEDPSLLFERYKGNVVLIVNEFYYEITAGESILYFSPNTKEKFFTDIEEVKQKPSVSFGTGFIMSESGHILTNRHVVSPSESALDEQMVSYFEDKRNYLEYLVKSTRDTLDNFQIYFGDSAMIETAENEKRWTFGSLFWYHKLLEVELNKVIDIDLTNASTQLVRQSIAIAFNDTFITEADDLQECIFLRESMDPNVDLALIQTKTQELQKRPQQFIDFADHNPNILDQPDKFSPRDINDPIEINEPVYMIGYNHGLDLALTSQGIKSQFTSGNISQKGDEKRILYTIPTLEGSSGSPVFDKWGNLVAVNFAKVADTQGFSFGVPVHLVKKFYNRL